MQEALVFDFCVASVDLQVIEKAAILPNCLRTRIVHVHRLKARGLKVLVEKKVARTEFKQFSAFNPDLGGKHDLLDIVLCFFGSKISNFTPVV